MKKLQTTLLLLLILNIHRSSACIGGGGGGAACCPSAAASCAPSVPVCPGGSYASSYAGGSYAAPQQSYPRPLPAPSPSGCGGASTGCGASAPAPQISIISPPLAQPPPPPPPPPHYISSPSYAPPPPPPPPASAPVGSSGSYAPQNLPPPDPASEIENSYDDFREEHTNGAGGVYGKPNSYDQGSILISTPNIPAYSPSTPASTDYTVQEPPPPPPAPIDQKPSYEGKTPADTGYTSTVGDSTDDAAATNNVNVEVDEASLNCEDSELRKIVETSLVSSGDNLDAARKIESEAAAKFGGRFNSIVSNSEFAYVNWYGKRNCQLRVNDRHSLTWED
ncbi:unnamed protein product [Bursaphelenchus okinawaensis]|uniref:Ground-like domain-containing protein n=1 Tax=Bursaphelenchus okinawaensis TaxID=465554 RepID=A0A811JQS4_9BILA|nr:unnamed protein product [Bursaphelenchus okinawaensis]CAG9078451.1 unnamed protein product [Bursaphelenchus okinawaensis]